MPPRQSKTSMATSSLRRRLSRMVKHLNLSPRKNRLCLYILIRWNPCEAISPSSAPARQREIWARWWQPCASKSRPSRMNSSSSRVSSPSSFPLYPHGKRDRLLTTSEWQSTTHGQLARKPFASQGDKTPEKSILRYMGKYLKIHRQVS